MPETPKHLSQEAQKIWQAIIDEFQIDDSAGVEILRVSLEAFDRAQAARADIEKRGMMYQDRFGQIKVHPLLCVERDARAAFLAGLKQLGLEPDLMKAKKPGRVGAYAEYQKMKVVK